MADPSADREYAVVPTRYDPGSYTCVRSLSQLGVGTIVASEKDDVPAAASRFCDRLAILPSAFDDLIAYKDALVDLAARPEVRTILPLRSPDPYVFAKYEAEFAPHVTLVSPSLERLDRVFDRMRLYEAAVDAGVPVPETRPLSEVAGSDAASLTDDVIVKSRYNLLADRYADVPDPSRVRTVKSVEHFPAGERLDAAGLRDRMGHDPIVQEYVEDIGEYVFGALYDHGEPVATFQHRQIRGDSYTGGGGVFRKSCYDTELERVGRALLDELDWHGLACIEYAKDADTGEYKLIELNPRLWQSLPCAVQAGADFPAYYWLLATDRADEIDPAYRLDVGTHLLYGELGYLGSVVSDDSPLRDRPSLARETLSVVESCLRSPNFDNLRFDDPAPFLRGLRHVLANRLPIDQDAEAEDTDAGAEDPDAGAEDPDVGVEDPDAGVEDPDVGVEDPDAGVENPNAGVEDPTNRTVEPAGDAPTVETEEHPDRPMERGD